MGDDLYMDAHMLIPDSYAQKFVKNAIRTESQVEQVNPRITHAVVGIMTECIEYMTHIDPVNAKEEIGDILWYMAILADELREDLQEWIDAAASGGYGGPIILVSRANELLDVYKKRTFYGKGKSYRLAVIPIIQILIGLATKHETSIQSEMQRVIAKLRTRYPEKFTKELAENRNLNAERKTLEGYG